ncbi:MAG: hypothetical protein CL868_14990 [Cytophagaceae bacterium]|nr:hypothetical protein [Cytophagaceae bacterium]|tara:strand:- start:3541 stop:4050 length:510 start_codon:yes stop_codon:yes gene_type:complete
MKINRKISFILAASLMILLSACNNPTTAENVVPKAPKGTISTKEARELSMEFAKTRQPLLDSIAGREESVSSWWSLEDIKSYIAFAEKTAAEKGYKMDGIRIYQAAYPKDFSDKEKAGYMTMLIVPTGTNTGEQKGGFSFMLEGDADLDVAPLNFGYQNRPPGKNYPKN